MQPMAGVDERHDGNLGYHILIKLLSSLNTDMATWTVGSLVNVSPCATVYLCYERAGGGNQHLAHAYLACVFAHGAGSGGYWR